MDSAKPESSSAKLGANGSRITSPSGEAGHAAEPRPGRGTARLNASDVLLLWIGLVSWVMIFLLGTLVDSGPYRASVATLTGGLPGTLTDGAVVCLTYTLTNVAILCVLSGVLGTLGAKARLGSDREGPEDPDTTSPRNSAVLRSFLVYLLVLSGLLILGDDPASPTQRQYVRLAGFISVLGFIVNYRPKLFGRLLKRAGSAFEEDDEAKRGGEGTRRPEPAS